MAGSREVRGTAEPGAGVSERDWGCGGSWGGRAVAGAWAEGGEQTEKPTQTAAGTGPEPSAPLLGARAPLKAAVQRAELPLVEPQGGRGEGVGARLPPPALSGCLWLPLQGVRP